MPRVLRAIEVPTTFQGVLIGAFGLRVRRLQGSVWRAAIPSPNDHGALKPAGRSYNRLLMHLVTISHDLPICHRHSQGTVMLHVQGSVLLSKLRQPVWKVLKGSVLLSKLRQPAWDDRATRRDASARVQIAIPIEIAIPLEFTVELTFEL